MTWIKFKKFTVAHRLPAPWWLTHHCKHLLHGTCVRRTASCKVINPNSKHKKRWALPLWPSQFDDTEINISIYISTQMKRRCSAVPRHAATNCTSFLPRLPDASLTLVPVTVTDSRISRWRPQRIYGQNINLLCLPRPSSSTLQLLHYWAAVFFFLFCSRAFVLLPACMKNDSCCPYWDCKSMIYKTK